MTEQRDPDTWITGTEIREIRERAGLTLKQVAEVANVSPQFVSQVELGDRPAPELLFDTILALDPDQARPGEPETEERRRAQSLLARRGPMRTKPSRLRTSDPPIGARLVPTRGRGPQGTEVKHARLRRST